jgi:hypothetical protein
MQDGRAPQEVVSMLTSGRRFLPTPSMAVSLVALLIALGGTSYAVAALPARSVGSKQLKPKAVAGAHIKSNAITSAKVKDGSLTGKDVNAASLGKVASSAVADQAARAGVAGGLDRVVYRVSAVTVPPAPPTPPGSSTTGFATARCDPGQLVVGGGVKLPEDAMSIVDSYPETAAAWTAHVNNDDPASAQTATVFAVCIAASTPG